MVKKWFGMCLLVVAMGLFAACGGNKITPDKEVQPVPPELIPAQVEVLEEGDSLVYFTTNRLTPEQLEQFYNTAITALGGTVMVVRNQEDLLKQEILLPAYQDGEQTVLLSIVGKYPGAVPTATESAATTVAPVIPVGITIAQQEGTYFVIVGQGYHGKMAALTNKIDVKSFESMETGVIPLGKSEEAQK